MSKITHKLTTHLTKALLVGACSLGIAMTANAAPMANTASVTKSSPVFLGDGGNYPFSEAVRVGDTLYMSGQIGFKDGKLVEGSATSKEEALVIAKQDPFIRDRYKSFDLYTLDVADERNDFGLR